MLLRSGPLPEVPCWCPFLEALLDLPDGVAYVAHNLQLGEIHRVHLQFEQVAYIHFSTALALFLTSLSSASQSDP